MLFNSLDFAIFLPIVFTIYWLLPKNTPKYQNYWIVIASYFFYGWWDSRFLILMLISTVTDYIVAQKIANTNNKQFRKLFLGVSLFVNLSLLGFFKYYNFFIENFTNAFQLIGTSIDTPALKVILPIGISFYTFQTLSYTIDVYRKHVNPAKDFVVFAAFVSFFPQLVIGPIERASNMLPQYLNKRVFKYEQALLGSKQIIWGLFKKVVIADSCMHYVNPIFENYESMSTLTLLLGLCYFTIQVYADFSGYSDMAIGTARLFGFNLKPNFNYPLFRTNVADFWRNWHISLMNWFKDYVYIPLGGKNTGRITTVRNVIIVFVLSGIWHGADWTFVLFGLYHGILYAIFYVSNNTQKIRIINGTESLKERLTYFTLVTHTFFWVSLGMLFFRAPSLQVVSGYLKGIFQNNWNIDQLEIGRYSFEIIPLLLLLFVFEWRYVDRAFPLDSKKLELSKTIFVIVLIIFFGSFSELKEFIYFKF